MASLNMFTVGVTVQLIQDNIPMNTDGVNTKGECYRWAFAVFCGISSALIILLTLISWKVKFGER